MLFNVLVASALCAAASAAPTFNAAGQQASDIQALSDYFSLLGSKVHSGKSLAVGPPSCNLASATMPTIAGPSGLPPVSAGLTLKHVAIGRGTQNYTCGTDATAAPVAVGALATLFNASCVAASYPDILTMLPNVALQFDLGPQVLAPSDLLISGHHYFTTTTTPTFNLNTASMQLGLVNCAKNNSAPAPAGSSVGQHNQGYGAVAWLKLIAKAGATGGLQEVYRVNTAGGSPPPTCSSMPATFQVQYSAEYWFYATS